MSEHRQATPDFEQLRRESFRIPQFSFEQLEGAIAKAISELTGEPYTVEINRLNRRPPNEPQASFYDIVDIDMRVRHVGPPAFEVDL
jgi:hypothetical protein